jgi:geranylgeranyl diphosphate synthase type I
MPESLATMAGYHFGWSDKGRVPAGGAAGKYLRPALVLGAAAACGDCSTAAAVPAAAVELMHNFSLLHDDILDADLTRRGRPTVWSVWGTGSAILLGDAIHAEAIRILTSAPGTSLAVSAATRLEDACVQICRGQYEDCTFERCPTVTVAAYQRMAAGKTAGLMGCACARGALAAGADTQTTAAMERFGFELGLAFQYVDDLMGVWGDLGVTGKPVVNDISRRKATLPGGVGSEYPMSTSRRSGRALPIGGCAVTRRCRPGDRTRRRLGQQADHPATRRRACPGCHRIAARPAAVIALAHLVIGRQR